MGKLIAWISNLEMFQAKEMKAGAVPKDRAQT
jgi:hypothetical protein